MNKVENENERRRKSDIYVPLSLIATILTVISATVGIYSKINELNERAFNKNQNFYDRLTKIETKLDMHLNTHSKDKK